MVRPKDDCVKIFDKVFPVDVDWDGSIIVQILTAAVGALQMNDECLRVRLSQPELIRVALALVVAASLVKLLVRGAQQLAVVSGHAFPSVEWGGAEGTGEG
eukprot:6156146-Prymnesium_polylepis.2